MTSTLKFIVELCENHGFLKFISKSETIGHITLGPVGYLLQENLKSEWLYSNLTNRDISVFLNMKSNFSETFDFVKKICNERIPFGIVHILCDTNKNIESSIKLNNTDVNQYLNCEKQIKLQSYMFVSPNNSVQYFHNWQRQRRMWWRKFSSSPERYFLTDIESSDGKQSVEIMSKFSWGSNIIEKLVLNSNGDSSLLKEQLQVKDGRKRLQCHCITSTVYLNTMVLNTLYDAFDETLYQNENRYLLRFHRKIAPYKISFASSSSNSSNIDELNELCAFLCRKLRSNNISVLLLPSASRNTLDSQWIQYDQMGIPYCVILNDNTLKNGIAYLRNRDTTLKEQVHISDLSEYVVKLFNNY